MNEMPSNHSRQSDWDQKGLPFGEPVEQLYEYDLQAVLSSSKPLILKHFCSSWPVVKASAVSSEAVLEYIQACYARVPVTTCILHPKEKGRVFYNNEFTGFNFSANLESFNTFSRMLLNETHSLEPRGVYMPSTDAAKWFPDLDKENNAGIDYLDPIKLIWIGNKIRVAAHYDFTSNLACCLAGRRRFTLFPPEQIANLYPGPLEFAPGGQEISLVDFANPDLKTFPKFAEAMKAAQVAELEPGDALFLPGMWWHHVEGLDAVNILYTHWWRESPALLGRPSNALLHSIMSLRSLSAEQRKAWKSVFDYYVFNYDTDDLNNIPAHARNMLELPLGEEQIKQIRKILVGRLDK
jgi:hypothetical protein